MGAKSQKGKPMGLNGKGNNLKERFEIGCLY